MILVKRVQGKIRRLLGGRWHNAPTRLTSRGVSHRRWSQTQRDLEYNYWVHGYPKEVPPGRDLREYYAERYWALNREMFKTINGFAGQTVLDVGCGPFGSLDLCDARQVIGVDPLAIDYQSIYGFADNFIVLPVQAERIPLLDGVMDSVVSINALDHFERPYEALEEMHRVCKVGGHVLLATDVGGTPEHPCNIEPGHLDEFFDAARFEAIERDGGTHIKSSWSEAMEIPVYVFHGVKR